jgi:hypothetical protein
VTSYTQLPLLLVDAIRKYLGSHLQYKLWDLERTTILFYSDPDNPLYRGSYIKALLNYRRFEIMDKLANNIDKIPYYHPLNDEKDKTIVEYLTNGVDFSPYSRTLGEAQFQEMLKISIIQKVHHLLVMLIVLRGVEVVKRIDILSISSTTRYILKKEGNDVGGRFRRKCYIVAHRGVLKELGGLGRRKSLLKIGKMGWEGSRGKSSLSRGGRV